MVWAALANLIVNACFFVVMLRLVRDGFQPAEIGLVSTSAGVGGILGALAAPTIIDRFATGRLTVASAGGACRRWCRWSFWNNPRGRRRRARPRCCSTRPATPASAPTAPR